MFGQSRQEVAIDSLDWLRIYIIDWTPCQQTELETSYSSVFYFYLAIAVVDFFFKKEEAKEKSPRWTGLRCVLIDDGYWSQGRIRQSLKRKMKERINELKDQPEEIVEAEIGMFIKPRFDAQPFWIVNPRVSIPFAILVPFLDVPFVGFSMIVMMTVTESVTGSGRSSPARSRGRCQGWKCRRRRRRSGRLRWRTMIARIWWGRDSFRQLGRPARLVSTWSGSCVRDKMQTNDRHCC